MPADADPVTIKKSFRKLAFLYHPDKHPDNAVKHKHFLLIQDAYQTLLNPESRKNYDTELWLAQKNSFHYTQVITAQLMIKRLQKFAESVKIKKQFSVLENDTAAFLLDGMNDQYTAVFQTKATDTECEIYADYILFIAQDLPKSFRDNVFERLNTVLSTRVGDLQAKIFQIQAKKKASDLYAKNLIWITIIFGFVICIMMYLYGSFKK